MYKYSFSFLFLIIVVIFDYLNPVFAENDFYVVSIRRSENDKAYDEASVKEQNAVDDLVNDRMNDIYDIIEENKETYADEDGTIDEKLDEFESLPLRKRNAFKRKIKFLNLNRLKKKEKRSEEEDIEYVYFKSQIVYHICPVSNYYVIRAYLSDVTAEKVKQLPNVISCNKDIKIEIEHSVHEKLDNHTSLVKRATKDFPNSKKIQRSSRRTLRY